MSQAKVEGWAHSDKGSPWRHAMGGGITAHRQSGGYTDSGTDASTYDNSSIGGVTPSSYSNNPLVQGMLQRYSSYSTEQLTQLAAMMGGTTQGRLIQQLLQQRRMMPNASQQQGQSQQLQSTATQLPGLQQTQQQQSPTISITPQSQQQSSGTTFKRGGGVAKRQSGGMSMSTADPWWTRAEARGADMSSGSSGLLHGLTGGRADAVETQAPGGSHVVPADVISGLGEGNSLAGARVMQAVLSSGPWGSRLPSKGSQRDTIPRPPPVPKDARGGALPVFDAKPRAKGGHTGPGGSPVDLSDGEFIISPEQVARIGGGDPKKGHAVIDRWIMEMRKRHIKTLKKLPPPVGMKKHDRASA